MKQKIASSFINMTGILFLVTVVSATALSSVYRVTKDIIDDAAQKKQMEALKTVITADYDNNPFADATGTENVKVYSAKKGNKTTAVAVKSVSTKGYGGNVEVMMGMSPDGVVSNVVVVSQTETPGLGTKVTEPNFLSQFKGKKLSDFVLKVKKDGGDVDAITGATISSRAVADALNRAYYFFVNGKELQENKDPDAKTGATKEYHK